MSAWNEGLWGFNGWGGQVAKTVNLGAGLLDNDFDGVHPTMPAKETSNSSDN